MGGARLEPVRDVSAAESLCRRNGRRAEVAAAAGAFYVFSFIHTLARVSMSL